MNLTTGFPFWTVRDGLICVYPPLLQSVHCDALIVGGGISGALLAYELVKRGVDCVMIDRRDIGYGSTSASTALLQYEIDTPLHELKRALGEKAAERAYLLGVGAIHQLEKLAGSTCGFAIRPSLQIASSASHITGLKKELEARRKIGLAVSWMDQSELAQRGIKAAGGLRSTIAAEVDPYRLTHRLLRLSQRRGLQVFDRTAAVSYQQTRGGVTVKTDRGAGIRCKRVFFATGYETQQFLPQKIMTLKSTYAFVSEPIGDLSWWRDRALIWETGTPYLYMRTTSDNRVLVGGEDDGVLNGHKRDQQLSSKTARLMSKFGRRFSGKEIEPAFQWAGAFGSTKDGLAYIGPHPAFPQGYFALGFGGNGITFSQIAAKLLADLFLGHTNPDAEIFSFDR